MWKISDLTDDESVEISLEVPHMQVQFIKENMGFHTSLSEASQSTSLPPQVLEIESTLETNIPEVKENVLILCSFNNHSMYLV